MQITVFRLFGPSQNLVQMKDLNVIEGEIIRSIHGEAIAEVTFFVDHRQQHG